MFILIATNPITKYNSFLFFAIQKKSDKLLSDFFIHIGM